METYTNANGNSSITRYQTGSDYIIVEFAASKYTGVMFYKYTYASAGSVSVENMKQLAKRGSGLGSYINTNKVPHASKSASFDSL